MKETLERGVTRRGFLDVALGATTALGMLAMVGSVFGYLWPGQAGGTVGAKRVKVGPLADLAPGTSTKLSYNGKPVIVINVNDKVKGFYAKCTHLGCVVNWESIQNEFVCPCHAAEFDANGVSQTPIASEPLRPISVKVVDEIIYVEGV